MRKVLLIFLVSSLATTTVNAQENEITKPVTVEVADVTMTDSSEDNLLHVVPNFGEDSISFKIKDGYFWVKEGPKLYRRLESGFEEHNLATPLAVAKPHAARNEKVEYLTLVYKTKDGAMWQATYDLKQDFISGVTTW